MTGYSADKLNKEDCNYIDVARFVGIYIVICGHFLFTYRYIPLTGMIYSFHMPLFFMISGILHKIHPFSKSSFLKLVIALLVPYFLYNIIALVYLLFAGNSFQSQLPNVISTLLGKHSFTITSWFFLALFWVKLLALFFVSKKRLIVFSLFCIAFTFIYKRLALGWEHDNVFMIRTALMSFPFFTIGFLFKEKLQNEINNYLKFAIATLFAVATVLLCLAMGSMNLAEVRYTNLFVVYLVGTIGSVSLLLFSQLALRYIKFGFVKDISRGTMMIVGLHAFVMYFVFPDFFYKVTPLRFILLKAALLLFVFYLIIKLTYDRIPILYGRLK